MSCIVYGYGQASLDPSVPSTHEQESVVRSACATLMQSGRLPANAAWAGFVRDEATRKPVKFHQRQAASMLLAGLGPENAVIAASHDRIFSNVVDACEVLEAAQQRQFLLIVLDYGIDTSAPRGLVLSLAAMMKALRQRERRRTKEEFDYRKTQGMPAGGRAPIGWEIVRAKLDGNNRAYFVPAHGARRLAMFIVEHYDRWGGTFEQTAYWLNAQKFHRPDGKKWRKTAVHNWYHAAKGGFPLPNGRREAYPIPLGATPALQHWFVMPDDED
jgi:DNA invertase Pin-like site-specific DNA recombinase